jgi:hypothetical protein
MYWHPGVKDTLDDAPAQRQSRRKEDEDMSYILSADGKLEKDTSNALTVASSKRELFTALLVQVDRAEAAEARAAQLEAERDGWVELAKKTLDSAGLSYGLTLQDAIHKLITERDELAQQLAAEQAAHQTDVTALNERIRALEAERVEMLVNSIRGSK